MWKFAARLRAFAALAAPTGAFGAAFALRRRVTAVRPEVVYPLRAAGSLQLAAALTWCRQRPDGKTFIGSDKRLDEAAGLEGFSVIAL